MDIEENQPFNLEHVMEFDYTRTEEADRLVDLVEDLSWEETIDVLDAIEKCELNVPIRLFWISMHGSRQLFFRL